MQAKVLDVPPVVTDQERADEWADQLEDLLLEVGRIFPRADLRRRAAACVRGLLGPLSRKNGWQIAEHAGDSRPDGQQHLLNRACWDVDELRDVVRRYVVEGLADDGAGLAPGGAGVLVIDLCRSWNYAEVPAACGGCCWPWASEWGVRGRRAGIVR
jgi:hypothetical protein